jgi:hypothetical protein
LIKDDNGNNNDQALINFDDVKVEANDDRNDQIEQHNNIDNNIVRFVCFLLDLFDNRKYLIVAYCNNR